MFIPPLFVVPRSNYFATGRHPLCCGRMRGNFFSHDTVARAGARRCAAGYVGGTGATGIWRRIWKSCGGARVVGHKARISAAWWETGPGGLNWPLFFSAHNRHKLPLNRPSGGLVAIPRHDVGWRPGKPPETPGPPRPQTPRGSVGPRGPPMGTLGVGVDQTALRNP